jgi:ferric-dicitrate binding protein FerR (iron transport regulator)
MFRRDVVLFAVTLGVITLARAPAASAADAIGRVIAREGAGVALRAGETITLGPGAAIFLTDAVRTGDDGKLRIECFNGLTIIVGPASEIRIERYVGGRMGGMAAAIRLLRGIVRLVGEAVAGPSDVAVETDQAIAAVRSTDWLVEAEPATTGIFVARGAVEVMSKAGGSVMLEPGEGTDIREGAAPTPPRQWGEARRAAALARTTL